MTLPEHLDPESTAPDLPDGYDPDGGWTAQEWWDALEPVHHVPRCPTCDDIQWPGDACDHWPADFDDEERRP